MAEEFVLTGRPLFAGHLLDQYMAALVETVGAEHDDDETVLYALTSLGLTVNMSNAWLMTTGYSAVVHATYVVSLVACATVLVLAGAGWAARIALVTVATVIVAVVAVSRVYLRAHYLTDVLGGVALGIAVYSFVGVLALFAGRVRHNGAPP